jgi:hypothetical protein
LAVNLPLVEGLVGGDGHLNLVADTEEENATLGLTESDLADDFIEALGEQFFADGANSGLTGLTFHQFLIEGLTETGNIDSGSLLMADVFDEVLAVLNPLTRGKDSIDNLLLLGLRFHGRELSLLLAYIIRKRFSSMFEIHESEEV